MRANLAKVQISLAVAFWLMAAIGVAGGWEPFAAFLYFFAWWPLLLFLDGLLLQLIDESWLWDRPWDFLHLAFTSVTIWLIFELFNLRLHNWRYVGLEPLLPVRWAGYALAFATVLPGILLASQVLAALGAWRRVKGSSSSPFAWQPLFLVLGAACLVLPLVQPLYAFPLVWLAFYFLLDPLCDLLSGESLTRRFLAGEHREHLCLLTAGLLTGVWWELWNYPASAKWVYTLPVLNFGKVFEMPLLGYLGFPPFALTCAVMYNFSKLAEERFFNTPPRRRGYRIITLLFWLSMFGAIDAFTVLSWR